MKTQFAIPGLTILMLFSVLRDFFAIRTLFEKKKPKQFGQRTCLQFIWVRLVLKSILLSFFSFCDVWHLSIRM